MIPINRAGRRRLRRRPGRDRPAGRDRVRRHRTGPGPLPGPGRRGRSRAQLLRPRRSADRRAAGRVGLPPRRPAPPGDPADLARLLALTGPTVLAVDQLDALMAQSRARAAPTRRIAPLRLLNQVAERADGAARADAADADPGRLHPRHLAAASETSTLSPAADRFTVVQMKGAMPGAEVAEMLVAKHLTGLYGDAGYTAPYPTWPVRPEAFTRPRRPPLHAAAAAGPGRRAHPAAAWSPVSWSSWRRSTSEPAVAPPPPPIDDAALAELDRRFAEYRAAADVARPARPRRPRTS